MIIDKTHVSEVTVTVFKDMLGINIFESAETRDEFLPCHFASIEISGAQQALIQVAACGTAGNAISSAMFGTDSEELAEADVADAVCEIANVIGGNVKGILDSDCSLSIPCYSCNHDSNFAGNADSIKFDLCGGMFQVTSEFEA